MQNYKLKHLRKDIVDSIKGSKQDFTDIALGRGILLLAVPMVLEMMMESVFAVVDIFFVSKIGPDAVAAVGITESLMTLVYSVAMGLATAATAMVARRIGEKDPKAASRASLHAITAGLAVSVIMAIPGLFFAKDLLKLMGASPGVIEAGSGYTAIMISSNVVIVMIFVINAVFRSAGDAAISMRVLWLANIINIILDPCLIFGLGPFPELGVTGAAVATCIGRGIAVSYQVYLLLKGRGRVKLYTDQIKFKWEIFKRLFRLSSGGIAQSIIAHSSWIGMVRIISEFGSDALAGYTIAIRVVIFSLLPSWGLSNAAATLMGQNLGAKKPDRAERAVWVTSTINMVFMGIVAVFFIFWPEFFMRLFIDNPSVIAQGAICLRFISYGYLAYGCGMVIVQAFNGAGDTATPTKINFFCFWLLEIPLAWFLAIPMGVGTKGVYIAIVAAETMLTVVGIYIFRKGKWRTKEL